MAYAELYNQYQLVEDENGVSGRRGFVRDDTNGTLAYEDLPEPNVSLMLDEDGLEISKCWCRSRTKTLDEAGHVFVTCQYSTKPQGNDPGASISNDEDSRAYHLGAADHPVDGKGWFWKTTGLGIVNQTIYRRVVAGSFSRTVTVSEASLATWRSTADGLATKISNAAFEGYNAGEVMFVGYSGGTTTNSDGDLEYRFDLNFEFLLLRAWGITTDSHNYMLNADSGAWDRPNTASAGTGDYLYESADLSVLFSV